MDAIRFPASAMFWAALICLAAAAGCFRESNVPACDTLADCPAGQGYTGCLDGWCFRQAACGSRPAVAGDGCCAVVEGDRSDDLDCLLLDTPLSCTDAAGPTIDDDGDIFVSCVMTAGDGVRSVAVRRLDYDGILSVPLVVGAGSTATPPVMGSGDTLFVASADGMVRYHTRNLSVVKVFDITTPVGPMASNRGADTARKVVAWPSSDGRVEIWDEDREVLFAYGEPRPDLGAGGALQPTVSWTGRRLYVTWKQGVLDVLEIGSNPLGPVLSMQLPALPAGAAVDVDGRIYVPLMDGRLVRYRETAALRLEEVWSVVVAEAGQPVDLLVSQDNLIAVVARSGDVNIVRDMDTFGSITATGDFGTALDGTHPVLADTGRIVAVDVSGRIVTVRYDAANSAMVPGLNFTVPSRPASGLVLDGGSLTYVSDSGSLVSWVFPDGEAAGRFIRGSGDNGSTGRTSEPASKQVIE